MVSEGEEEVNMAVKKERSEMGIDDGHSFADMLG